MGVIQLIKTFDIFYYKHYKANIYKNKEISWRAVKIFAVIFCILITLMFTSIMTGGFFINISRNGVSINMEIREYYGLCFGSYGTLTEAEKAASSLKARGGGGYIHKDNSYKVFAALYLNKADAESVASRLNNTGSSVSVQKIEIQPYKFIYDNNVVTLKKLTEILELFNFTIENLYMIFIDLDRDIINELDAQVRVNDLKNEAARLKYEFDNTAADETSHQIISLKAELVSLQINLGIICESSYITENMSIEIKYYMLKIAFSYQAFVNEIK